MRYILLLPMLASSFPALAADFEMMRVLVCEGDDAHMEVFVPNSAVSGLGVDNVKLDKAVVGAYTLDVSAFGKGKYLESVRVSLTSDKKFVVVDQYQRGLPATKIPVEGGTVDFDQRFASRARCAPFNAQSEQPD